MTAVEDQYCFKVQWFDPQADLLRTYELTFYPRDNSVAMFDPKAHRAFLKRTQYFDLRMDDLHIGGNVTVHSRQLKIMDYGDAYTRRVLESNKSRTLGIIKPDVYSNLGLILKGIYENGMVCGKLQMVKMSLQQAQAFSNLAKLPPASASHLSSDVVLVMEIVGKNACQQWQEMIGAIRAQMAADDIKNCAHGSASLEDVEAELDFFFGPNAKWPTTALFNNCTLCVIRPHIVQQGLLGDVLHRILSEGFEISAMKMWHMDKVTVEEFLDVYRGVLPEYQMIIDHMCVGPSVVLEVRQKEAVESFRQLVGYHDPEVSKHLRGDTLRAQFGIDRVRNAVHCTDLPEDGLLEVEYFFNMLYNRGEPGRKN
jgi:nucleoside-diphosphate kinase